VTIQEKDSSGYNALLRAASKGHLATVQWLLKEGGANIREKTYFGHNSLLIATKNSHFEVVKWLLKCGASINAGDYLAKGYNEEITCLINTCIKKRTEMKAALSVMDWKQVEELLTDKDMPYFVYTPDEKGNTCLHYLVKKIISLKKDDPSHYQTAMEMLEQCNSISKVKDAWVVAKQTCDAAKKRPIDYAKNDGDIAKLFYCTSEKVLRSLLLVAAAPVTQIAGSVLELALARQLHPTLEANEIELPGENYASRFNLHGVLNQPLINRFDKSCITFTFSENPKKIKNIIVKLDKCLDDILWSFNNLKDLQADQLSPEIKSVIQRLENKIKRIKDAGLDEYAVPFVVVDSQNIAIVAFALTFWCQSGHIGMHNKYTSVSTVI
jgi:hypothetical protein